MSKSLTSSPPHPRTFTTNELNTTEEEYEQEVFAVK